MKRINKLKSTQIKNIQNEAERIKAWQIQNCKRQKSGKSKVSIIGFKISSNRAKKN